MTQCRATQKAAPDPCPRANESELAFPQDARQEARSTSTASINPPLLVHKKAVMAESILFNFLSYLTYNPNTLLTIYITMHI